MVELIVPPLIILVLSVTLIMFLSRALKRATDSEEMLVQQQNHQLAEGDVSPSWLSGYTKGAVKGISTLRDKTQRLAQKRRITAAVEEARANRTQDNLTPVGTTTRQAVEGIQITHSQNMSRMGEIILNYHRKTSEGTQQNVHDPAETHLIQTVEKDPQNVEAYERLGDFYMERQNFEDARECYKYVLRLDPKHRRAQEAMKNLDRVLA
jgi:cytochrome c-type biogenesis protein CcmH/NrfG